MTANLDTRSLTPCAKRPSKLGLTGSSVVDHVAVTVRADADGGVVEALIENREGAPVGRTTAPVEPPCLTKVNAKTAMTEPARTRSRQPIGSRETSGHDV
jgi:hypothetical protein